MFEEGQLYSAVTTDADGQVQVHLGENHPGFTDADYRARRGEIAAAALFLENWQLAADSVDYAARNNVVSVAQHFWSLSVQVQVFLLWPLLFAVVAIACRGAADKLHRTATLVLAGVFATSLVYSIELTITNQPLAYFHTLTRLWEFALGGLLALHGHRIALTRRGRVAAGWAGVRPLVDEVWFVEADEPTRITRLTERHEAHGKGPEAARVWATVADQANADLVASTRERADLVVRMG